MNRREALTAVGISAAGLLGLISESKGFTINHGKYAELQHIREYVKLMLGAPCVELPPNIDELTDYFIERGIQYNVNNLQQFVLDSVGDDYNEWVEACEKLGEKNES